MIELNCKECGYKSTEESDFATGYNNRTLCVDCRQKEIKQLYLHCADEVKEIIQIDKKELSKVEECLAYMNLNEYDKRIEDNIIGILEFYVNDLKEQIENHKSERENYLSDSDKY